MPKSEFKPHEGKGTSRTRRKLSGDLQEWYGASEAADAMIKYLPEPRPISDVLSGVMRKRVPRSRLVIFDIRFQWSRIAGDVAAKRTFPLRYQDGILDVEVSHPAYRAALTSRTIREAILAKVRSVSGAEDCRELRFVPAGARPPEKREPAAP